MEGIGWLPDAAEAAGVDVYVMPGFSTRSTWASGLTSILGVVWHHTATSIRWLDGHVAALLRDGRRDLSGPLSQIGVERDGTAVFVAAGRANHNGYGEWGNSSVGIEFYSDGVSEHLTDAQIRTGIILTTLVLKHERLPASRTKGHKETDPRRKIDPLSPPAMAAIRSQVAVAMSPPPPPPEPDPPVTTSKASRMLILHVTDTKPNKFFAVMPDGLVRLTDVEAYVTHQSNKDSVAVVSIPQVLFKKLYSGARAVSFNDDPVLGG